MASVAPHDHGVLAVVGVVAAPNAARLEAEQLVQPDRALVRDADLEREARLGLVDTDLGLGLISEKVVDASGALAPTFASVYAKAGLTPELDAALAEFSHDLLAANVIVGDMHAWNIVYGSDSRGGPRLVMIDGFGEKHAIPISSMSRTINRYRTKRLLKRMMEQVKRLVPVEG